VIEQSDGKMIGVEIKLSASPSARNIAGLKALQDERNFIPCRGGFENRPDMG
jgi:hypothetical protein